MDVKSLIFLFDKDLRNVDDKKFKDMLVPEKIAILNRAIDIFYNKIFQNRDKDPLFNQWLRPFFVDGKALKFIEDKEAYSLYSYPENFQTITSVYVKASKGDCKAQFDANPIMKQGANTALNSFFWEPSFEFEQSFRTFDQNGLAIYHKRQFKIDEAIANYIRRPKEVHAGKLATKGYYVYHDGRKIDFNSDLEFGEGAYPYMIDIAVLLATDNPSDLNLKVNKMLNIKNS
jgi:hypothetical protein